MKTISIVTPCFNEEMNVQECYEAVRDIFVKQLPSYAREHIFCDNASTDGTQIKLRAIAAHDPDVKVIVNARNFGPLRNAFNGVLSSSGDAVLLFLPADMQDPPELLPQFVRLWEEGNEIVYGIRKTREENAIMRALRTFYYRILTSFSEYRLPTGVGDFQLVDRRIVSAMREIHDTQPFMRLMTFECGGRAVGVPYTWRARKRGQSKNGFGSLFAMGMEGIVSFTTAPVRLALFAGLVVSMLSVLYAIANLIIGIVLYRQLAPPGIITLIVALFFFGGVQLFFLGVVGEYILAIYMQVRRKPIVFERERINFSEENVPAGRESE
jgi:glycosyltransferase involved in cell wall biosynthesis